MIAALESNPTFNEKENQQHKVEAVRAYEEDFQQSLAVVYGQAEPEARFEDDPLFNPLVEEAKRQVPMIDSPRMEGEGALHGTDRIVEVEL
jgi:hypothetical protein